MSMNGDCRLIDTGPIPVIYADDIANVVLCEPNVRILFFEYREIEGQRVRCIVLEMIRPIASCTPGALLNMIAQKRAHIERGAVLH